MVANNLEGDCISWNSWNYSRPSI